MKLRRSTTKDPRAELQEFLGAYELPVFPTVVANAVELITDPEVPLSQVSDVVQQDPGLSVHLLRMVNSMAYAPRTPIATVHQAATMLGRNTLESTLITFAVQRAVVPPSGSGFDPRSFWGAAAQRAAIASELAARVDPARKSDNFTAALLQDMAIPVLLAAKDSYGELFESWRTDGGDLADLESNEYPWTHGSIAELMGTEWGFPNALVESIAAHHEPIVADDSFIPAKLVSIIPQNSDDSYILDLTDRIGTTYNIAPELAAEIVNAGIEKGVEIAQILT